MEEYELKARLGSLIRNSIGRQGDEISQDRADGLRRYYALPYGDEKTGRSQVLTTECRDTIMWLLPSVIKTFLSTDKVVEFLPSAAGKEEEAEQQTDFINYLVMQENESFTIFHNWFLDALQCKNGYVKYGFEEDIRVKEETYTGLNEFGLARLIDNQEIKIVEIAEHSQVVTMANGQDMADPVYDVRISRQIRKPRYYIENIPPERVLVDNQATNMDDVQFIGAVYYKTRSDLVKMGYDRDLVDDLPTSPTMSQNYEANTRDEINKTDDMVDYDIIQVIECYVKLDTDDDGVDELHRIVVCGEDAITILEDEKVDDIPIVPIAPFLKPHSFFGDSMVDYTKDIQRINTTLWRQILDYIYLANNPMWEVEENSITNMNDALRRTPGGLVRTRRVGSITPIATTPLQPESFALLDRLKDMKDRRTGVMEINQGLDPNAINKTATGTIEIMDAGRQVQDLIVRVFAETGVKRLFKGLYGLVVRHQDIPRTVRLRNKWVAVDPSQWDEQVEVIVNVGLGTGTSRFKLAQLEGIYAKQMELMAMGIVTPQQIYNTMAKIVSVTGYKDIDAFIIDPSTLPPPQPQPPKPSVEDLALQEIKASVDVANIKAASDKYKADTDAETKRYRTDVNAEVDLIEKQTDAALKEAALATKVTPAFDLYPGIPDGG